MRGSHGGSLAAETLPPHVARLSRFTNSPFPRLAFLGLSLLLVAGNCQNPPPPPRALPSPKPLFLSKKGLGTSPGQDSIAYYNAIHALQRVPTLSDFRTANAFTAANETVAYYFNAGDLGLGREMHCTSRGDFERFEGEAACYVTNYGLPGGDPSTALPLVEQHDPSTQLATVAMEFLGDIFPDQMRFYVYAPQPNGDSSCRSPLTNPCLLLKGATLDSQGEKRVPEMCMSCHGGSLAFRSNPSSNPYFTGSSFLPFDVYSFRYSSKPGFTLADQQEAFRKLNSIVKLTRLGCSRVPHPDAICDWIDGLYPRGVDNAGSTSVDTYVPAGWVTTPVGNQTTYYNSVIKVYCRTCHTAQSADIDWTSFQQFQSKIGIVYSDVCTAPRVMPQAEVTWTKFWLSDPVHAPGFFEDSLFAGLTFPSPGTCTP